ncbi:MAG TPA: hypothetical protein VM912_02205 [Terriglobales bacterium]|nr:hypothetical protein [Terriglobales bacterium]
MILDQFRLDGRTALVTGASAGLGAAMAIALAEAGTDAVCPWELAFSGANLRAG